MKYKVSWTTEVEADSPFKAALMAEKEIREGDYSPILDVRDLENQRDFVVDLDYLVDEDAVQAVPLSAQKIINER